MGLLLPTLALQPPGCEKEDEEEEDITLLTRDEPRLGVPGSRVRLTAQLKCVCTTAK